MAAVEANEGRGGAVDSAEGEEGGVSTPKKKGAYWA